MKVRIMRVKNKVAKSTSRPANGKNTIGYGKPPKHSRFKPGTSGNPSGRPLGSLNKLPDFGAEEMKFILRTELYRDFEVVEGKKKYTVSAITAIAQNLVAKANAGDLRATQMLFEFNLRFESEEKYEYETFVRYAVVYLQLWQEFLEHALRFNIEVKEPIPHPRQFVMDCTTGLMTIKGPMTTCEAESGNFDDDVAIYSPAVARRFMATMKLPPGKDIRNYIRD